ncbi:hypothetical protein HB770_10475 [Rhizobium leguminosarum bv. viciae]|uniref:Uncharacterized protein n=1 Tax=Rhizobium leguminosarum bv. viciae TaxID=387 RepID=A0A7G6RJ58_RHILV|nr:hypothetical protein HB770_10475 [Rhizobium leguminosarum bv. viciae]
MQSAFGGARDLIEELELSIGAAPVSSLAQPAKAPQWSAASIRLPLANFHAPKRDEPVVLPEPVAETVAAPVAEAPSADLPVVEPQPVIEPCGDRRCYRAFRGIRIRFTVAWLPRRARSP